MRKPRKATFIKTAEGKYQPVNKLAKKLAKKTVGKAFLKGIARQSQAMCYVWTNAGLRKVC